MPSDQYSVLGKAPGVEELKKLSPDNTHLTINKLSAGYGKMEILHNFDLFVSKAQSLCLIGPNGAGKSTLSSKNIPMKKTRRIKIILIIKILLIKFLFVLGLNLSCIFVKLYLHSKIKT